MSDNGSTSQIPNTLNGKKTRYEKIIRDSILPILTAFRENHLTVIYVASSVVAERYPHHRIPDFNKNERILPQWLPIDLVNASGEFAKYFRLTIGFP